MGREYDVKLCKKCGFCHTEHTDIYYQHFLYLEHGEKEVKLDEDDVEICEICRERFKNGEETIIVEPGITYHDKKFTDPQESREYYHKSCFNRDRKGHESGHSVR